VLLTLINDPIAMPSAEELLDILDSLKLLLFVIHQA